MSLQHVSPLKGHLQGVHLIQSSKGSIK